MLSIRYSWAIFLFQCNKILSHVTFLFEILKLEHSITKFLELAFLCFVSQLMNSENDCPRKEEFNKVDWSVDHTPRVSFKY